MGRTVHMCMSVRGAIHNGEWRKSLVGSCRGEDGRVLTSREILDALLDHVAEGHKVMPFGTPCEGFSYEDGCPGHEDPPPQPASGETTSPTDETKGPLDETRVAELERRILDQVPLIRAWLDNVQAVAVVADAASQLTAEVRRLKAAAGEEYEAGKEVGVSVGIGLAAKLLDDLAMSQDARTAGIITKAANDLMKLEAKRHEDYFNAAGRHTDQHSGARETDG